MKDPLVGKIGHPRQKPVAVHADRGYDHDSTPPPAHTGR